MNDGGSLRQPLFVGRWCSIGRRVPLGAEAHGRTGLSTSPLFRACGSHGVWTGDGAAVAAGVRVRHGAVIGANAVVTRDVAPYAIVRAGTRDCRQRLPAEVVARLLATGWREADPQRLPSLPARHVLPTLAALESQPLPAMAQRSFRVLAPPG